MIRYKTIVLTYLRIQRSEPKPKSSGPVGIIYQIFDRELQRHGWPTLVQLTGAILQAEYEVAGLPMPQSFYERVSFLPDNVFKLSDYRRKA